MTGWADQPGGTLLGKLIADAFGRAADADKTRNECTLCNGDGGQYFNPDWPMGDCGDREWEDCACGIQVTPARKQELWTATNRAYSIARYGTPTG
jgi:hypothetical protein